MSRRGWVYAALLVALFGAAYVVGHVVADEVRTSQRQAGYLVRLVKDYTFEEQAGPSDSIRFPHSGPYDQRLGYTRLPDISQRLEARGYALSAQARMSPALVSLMEFGLFPPLPGKGPGRTDPARLQWADPVFAALSGAAIR